MCSVGCGGNGTDLCAAYNINFYVIGFFGSNKHCAYLRGCGKFNTSLGDDDVADNFAVFVVRFVVNSRDLYTACFAVVGNCVLGCIDSQLTAVCTDSNRGVSNFGTFYTGILDVCNFGFACVKTCCSLYRFGKICARPINGVLAFGDVFLVGAKFPVVVVACDVLALGVGDVLNFFAYSVNKALVCAVPQNFVAVGGGVDFCYVDTGNVFGNFQYVVDGFLATVVHCNGFVEVRHKRGVLCLVCLLDKVAECRDKHCGKHCYHGNDNDQFHNRETFFTISIHDRYSP